MTFSIQLDDQRGVPIYRQIYEAVVRALVSGELGRREQLPTIHELARRLGVNPNTVARSYRDLERDGHIVAHRGKGTFPAPAPAQPSPDRRRRTLDRISRDALTAAAEANITPSQLLQHLRSMVDES